jgi:hypothetical protein
METLVHISVISSIFPSYILVAIHDCVAIHAWHVENPTAFIAWQALKKDKKSNPWKFCSFRRTGSLSSRSGTL